nr:competence type IV pilus major pilin ComGC [Streptococcus entericus]
MKKLVKTIHNKSVKGFTLVEMLIVLLIVSVLLLLFVPNLSKQKEKIEASGGRALVKVVESQAEMYEMGSANKASLSALVAEEFITQDQADNYVKYVSEHQVAQNVPN